MRDDEGAQVSDIWGVGAQVSEISGAQVRGCPGSAISLFLLHYLGWNLEGLFCVIPYWVLEHLLRFGADWEEIGTIS